jgi:hypothetical protein
MCVCEREREIEEESEIPKQHHKFKTLLQLKSLLLFDLKKSGQVIFNECMSQNTEESTYQRLLCISRLCLLL